MNFFSLLVMVALAFGGGYLVKSANLLRRVRKNDKHSSWLLVYVGPGEIRTVRCHHVATGLQAADGVVYPAGLFSPVVPWSSVVPLQLGRERVYFFASNPVALAEHEALEHGRDVVALGSIFSGGGELTSMLQIAALSLPLVVMVVMWMSVSGLQSQISALQAGMELVKVATNAVPK